MNSRDFAYAFRALIFPAFDRESAFEALWLFCTVSLIMETWRFYFPFFSNGICPGVNIPYCTQDEGITFFGSFRC